MSDDNARVRKAREADYIFWLKKTQWHPAEAAILLGGYEPEPFQDGSLGYEFLAEDVDGIHRLIIESINSKDIAVVNSPTDWIEWAQRQNLTLPPALAEVATSIVSAKVGTDSAVPDDIVPPWDKTETAKPATQEMIIQAFPIDGGWGDKLQKAPSGKYKWLAGTWAHIGRRKPGDSTTYFPVKIATALAVSTPPRMTLAACDLAIRKFFPEWWSEWERESELLR